MFLIGGVGGAKKGDPVKITLRELEFLVLGLKIGVVKEKE